MYKKTQLLIAGVFFHSSSNIIAFLDLISGTIYHPKKERSSELQEKSIRNFADAFLSITLFE